MTPSALKRARQQLGLSVTEMADRLGTTARYVRRMETEEGRKSHRPVPPEVEEKINAMMARR